MAQLSPSLFHASLVVYTQTKQKDEADKQGGDQDDEISDNIEKIFEHRTQVIDQGVQTFVIRKYKDIHLPINQDLKPIPAKSNTTMYQFL